MPDDTTLPQAQGYFSHLPPPPNLPSPEEIYDTIMSKIEPELTTAQMPLLDKKYAGETEEQTKQRYERYSQAFMTYDEKFREYRRELEQGAHNYQRSIMSATEKRMRGEENVEIADIESQFSS